MGKMICNKFVYMYLSMLWFCRRGYDDNQAFDHLQQGYDANYSYPPQAPSAHNHNLHVPQTPGMGINHLNTTRGPYDTNDYEANEYNRRGDYYQNPSTTYGGDYFEFL